MSRGPPLTREELAAVTYWAAFKVVPSLALVAVLLARWGLTWLSVPAALFAGAAAFLGLAAVGERALPAWRRLFEP